MDISALSEDLIRRLQSACRTGELGRYRVVVMNDFSFDRLVHVDDFDSFMGHAATVLSRKGGLLPRSRQTIRQGGCAANTATALARLGIRTFFITKTDDLGLYLLDYYLERAGVDISHAKGGGTLALMTCLEVGTEKYNIMINDGDSFGSFGFDDLDGRDLELLESADLVGVFDWCLNGSGTDLAGRLFEHLDGTGIPTYLDTSDPAPRRDEIPELFNAVLSKPSLSYLNLNENELKQFTGAIDADDSLETIRRLAVDLKAGVPPVLSVHTSCFALSVGSTVYSVPTFRISPLRTTGAGDTWNGGNILGILLDLPPEQRLLLANAVAGAFIESPRAERPDVEGVASFIATHRAAYRETDVCDEE
jgi:sugar/nucleoside kinase (ribokinase family)